jgi:acetyl esterase
MEALARLGWDLGPSLASPALSAMKSWPEEQLLFPPPLRLLLAGLAAFGLPPAMIIVGEADPLRDEGEAYAAKLRQAGVPVTAVRYQGIIHDFVMVNAMRDTHAALAATAQGGEFLHAALHDQ